MKRDPPKFIQDNSQSESAHLQKKDWSDLSFEILKTKFGYDTFRKN